MTNVIIFSPADQPLDLACTRNRLAFARRRGYTTVAFADEWLQVDRALADGRANVVLFGYGDAEALGADDPTQLVAAPSELTPERLRAIVEDGATPPCGISAETVSSLRRLARMVARNSGPLSRCVKIAGVRKGVPRSDA